jgi:acyl dehydratase
MAINYEKIMAYRPAPVEVNYTKRDSMFYALSIGIGMDIADPGQLKYVYEKNLVAFPAMASVLGWTMRSKEDNDAFGIDPKMVVAADQRIVLHKPLQPEGRLFSKASTKEVIDKGQGGGAIVQSMRELTDEKGEKVATVEGSIFVRNHGGFGGKVTTTPEPPKVPEGPPDKVCDLATPPNIALVYRLNGDMNPLHADPEHAKRVGFPGPILHGLANYGIAAHAVVRSCADYDASRFQSMEARFVKPFFPGETLRTEMWVRGEDVYFRCSALGRDEIVLNNGLARIKS